MCIVDDKGLLLVCLFGRPLYHLDDPLRAVRTALLVMKGFKARGLRGRCGISKGSVFSGDANTATRLMACTQEEYGLEGSIMVDQATYDQSKEQTEYKKFQRESEQLRISVKGKQRE